MTNSMFPVSFLCESIIRNTSNTPFNAILTMPRSNQAPIQVLQIVSTTLPTLLSPLLPLAPILRADPPVLMRHIRARIRPYAVALALMRSARLAVVRIDPAAVVRDDVALRGEERCVFHGEGGCGAE